MIVNYCPFPTMSLLSTKLHKNRKIVKKKIYGTFSIFKWFSNGIKLMERL